MEDGTPDHDISCSVVTGNTSCLADGSTIVDSCDTKVEVGSPMVEDCSLKSEDEYKLENNDPKTDGISFAMDVASPNSKMEVGSPNMEVTSPTMDVNSSCMEVASPKMEEGSAKMEEVAVKMGEVSVKSEDISTKCKENIASEQGSSKMEEVAVKMGEVSVKSEKYSVQSREGAVKTEENAEIRVQVYHGSKCVTEGEIPDWLTVDILVRAIYNDRPGTKKPLIRPFGSDSKTRTNGQRQATGKSQSFSQENSFSRSVNNHSANRSSGNNSVPEPTSSQSLSKTVNSQSPGKPSTSQSANKPSTSQSTSSKQSTSQISNTPSCSTGTERPSNTSVGNQNKGKSSGGRIKGKSSVSLYKGKAPASEAASRASVQLETKTCIGPDSSSSTEIAEGRLVDKNSESKSSENDSAVNFVSSDSNISSDSQGVPDSQGVQDSSQICAYSDNLMGDISRNIEDNATPTENLVQNSSSGIIEENDESASNVGIDNSDNCDFSSKREMSEMFKKPTDPPKRSVRKTNIPPKELLKQQDDPSKEPFKKPNDPPKRTIKMSSDTLKEGVPKPMEPMKVLFKESDEPPEGTKKVTDDSKVLFVNPDEHLKSKFNLPTNHLSSSEKPQVPLKKPKLPPLRVIRFIAQRLSSGNTVYRVRATAVRGSTAHDYHLIVKLCSSSAEITYYKKIAPRVPYVPRVLLCHNNIVVMDDLIHEGFRRPRGTLTPAQMTVAIDGLARMHTASVLALKRDPSLLEAFPQASKATESDIARDLHVLADRVKSWSLPDADYYAARCHALAECVPYLKERLEPADTNMTVLLHGNVSPRNVFFLYDSRNPRLPAMASFVDFANVYWGHPALDISLVTGPAGGFWEGYKIVLMSLLTRASGRMWLPQPEVKDCGETYAFALLRAVCSSVSGPAAKVLEAKLIELFPVFRQYSWLDFW